jgi:hypothetical protein
MTRLWPGGQSILVESDSGGTPVSFAWQGRPHRVLGVAKRWRVDQGWWRRRVWREYFKLYTHTGLLVIVYRDLLSSQWYLQRLYD